MKDCLLAVSMIVTFAIAAPLHSTLAAQAPPAGKAGHTGHAKHAQHAQHAEHTEHARKDSAARSDSAFAALQRRGAGAMGVDQYASSHTFDALADGGSITYVADVSDTAAVAQIRHHLREIATAFAAGDFTTPMAVHAREVPGTAVMKSRRDRIRYAVTDRPGGAVLRMTTTDPVARSAIADFMAFQRSDHRAPGQPHHRPALQLSP